MFLYDGDDLTTQSVKETQELINEKLGISPHVLARTMFHGQHALNELLDSTDTKLKEELSLVVPLSVWQEALLHTRQKAREATKRASELDGMLSIRSEDVARLQTRLDVAESTYVAKKGAFSEINDRLRDEIGSIAVTNTGRRGMGSLVALEEDVLRTGTVIADIERELETTRESRDEELLALENTLEKLLMHLESNDEEMRSFEKELVTQSLRYGVAKARVAAVQDMWKLDLVTGLPESFDLPESCPTCDQPISRASDANLHEGMKLTVRRDIEESLAELGDAQSSLHHAEEAARHARASRRTLEADVTTARGGLDQTRGTGSAIIREMENKFRAARAAQQNTSSAFAAAAKQLESEATVRSLEARLATERENLEGAVQAVDSARSELNDCNLRVASIESEKAEQANLAKVMTDLSEAFGQRGIQTFVMQSAVSALESSAQAYLDELSDGAQILELSLDAGDRINRRAWVRSAHGVPKERALSALSGGQWRRCSFALNLAFADLVARRANFRPSLCVMDEPLTHLDQSGRACVGQVLRGLLRRTSERSDDGDHRSASFHVSTILIILQDLAAEELEESFDCIDEVVKENGVSTLRLDE